MRVTLQARITLVVSLITLTALGIGTYFIKKYMENYILEQTSHRVLTIASTVAEDPEIIQAFNLSEPAQKIQPLAERIRKVTETSYVVVFPSGTGTNWPTFSCDRNCWNRSTGITRSSIHLDYFHLPCGLDFVPVLGVFLLGEFSLPRNRFFRSLPEQILHLRRKGIPAFHGY